jgi:hypothetical protein
LLLITGISITRSVSVEQQRLATWSGMAENTGSVAPNEPPNTSIRRVMTDHGNKAQRLLRVDQM